MDSLKDMINRTAQPGRVTWIGLRAARRAPLAAVQTAMITASGLADDHSRPGKRAVTLIQAEHLPAIAAYLGRDQVAPEDLRRNIVVRGVNLASFKGRDIETGGAVLRFTVICAPCSRMEETFGAGGYAAVRSHGGWCAEVLSPGTVSIGDLVRPRPV